MEETNEEMDEGEAMEGYEKLCMDDGEEEEEVEEHKI